MLLRQSDRVMCLLPGEKKATPVQIQCTNQLIDAGAGAPGVLPSRVLLGGPDSWVSVRYHNDVPVQAGPATHVDRAAAMYLIHITSYILCAFSTQCFAGAHFLGIPGLIRSGTSYLADHIDSFPDLTALGGMMIEEVTRVLKPQAAYSSSDPGI